jgi:hypothetical protein
MMLFMSDELWYYKYKDFAVVVVPVVVNVSCKLLLKLFKLLSTLLKLLVVVDESMHTH